MSTSRPILALLLAAAALGCRRDEVTHATVPKQAPEAPSMPAMAPPAGPRAGPPAAPPSAPGGPPSGMQGDVPPPPAPTGAGAVAWTLPKGWKEARTGGMRYATLTAPVAGKLDVSVVVLAGMAGGELGNVNRWRGQIGLAPVGEDGLPALRRQLKSGAGPLTVYDFLSEGTAKSRLVAAILVAPDGNSWFFKMVGDDKAVGQAMADFTRLLESVHLG